MWTSSTTGRPSDRPTGAVSTHSAFHCPCPCPCTLLTPGAAFLGVVVLVGMGVLLPGSFSSWWLGVDGREQDRFPKGRDVLHDLGRHFADRPAEAHRQGYAPSASPAIVVDLLEGVQALALACTIRRPSRRPPRCPPPPESMTFGGVCTIDDRHHGLGRSLILCRGHHSSSLSGCSVCGPPLRQQFISLNGVKVRRDRISRQTKWRVQLALGVLLVEACQEFFCPHYHVGGQGPASSAAAHDCPLRRQPACDVVPVVRTDVWERRITAGTGVLNNLWCHGVWARGYGRLRRAN